MNENKMIEQYLNDQVERKIGTGRRAAPYHLGWIDQLAIAPYHLKSDARFFDDQDDEEYYLEGKLDAINNRTNKLFGE